MENISEELITIRRELEFLQKKVQKLVDNNQGTVNNENDDVEDIKQFWHIIEHLSKKGKIKHHREYSIQNNILYISLKDVYKMYFEYCVNRRKMTWSKGKISSLIKEVYGGERIKKRFGSFPGKWCYKLKYYQIGIKLI